MLRLSFFFSGEKPRKQWCLFCNSSNSNDRVLWGFELIFLLLISPSVVPYSLWLPCPSPSPGACSNSCPLSQWCHPTISFSVIHFSCLQSFPASGSFPVSQLLASGGQSIGVSGSKFCTQCASTFGKFSPGFRTGKYQFWFKSQRKAKPKNGQTEAQLFHSSHMPVK